MGFDCMFDFICGSGTLIRRLVMWIVNWVSDNVLEILFWVLSIFWTF